MNALEKYAAKAKLTEKLMEALAKAKATAGGMASKTKQYGHTVKGTRVEAAKASQKSAAEKLKDLAGSKPATKGRKGKGAAGKWQAKQRSAHTQQQKSTANIPKEEAATSKARKQVGAGFAGLAGLGALGLGVKAIGKRSASKQAIKGTQSAAKRLGSFAKKNKRVLAVGGGAAGGAAALGAILNKKKK